ncbi:mycothiol transferase [Streptomyces cyaneochromogenes]|uniref:mycothiol transferase n=1 Tax=Streptomyces cyaneochromogenes TaxID=2496836 RepID=UPI00389A5BC2
MLIHLVEATGRHAGHADIVRELLDGAKGYCSVSPVGCDRSQSRIEATVTVP